MRESNFNFPAYGRAAISISSGLYDRRALDAPAASLPLVNSLHHLSNLTATSPRIREILSGDGGLERLVRILKHCASSPSPSLSASSSSSHPPETLADLKGRGSTLPRQVRKNPFKAFAEYDLLPSLDDLRDLEDADVDGALLLASGSDPLLGYTYSIPQSLFLPAPQKARHLVYTYSLAFQCIVNIGVRGSEAIRTRVVEAGALDVIVHVLERYLEGLERKRVQGMVEWQKKEDERRFARFTEEVVRQVQREEDEAIRTEAMETDVTLRPPPSTTVDPTATHYLSSASVSGANSPSSSVPVSPNPASPSPSPAAVAAVTTPTGLSRPLLTRLNVVAASASSSSSSLLLAPPSRVHTPDTVVSMDEAASLTGDENENEGGSASGQEADEEMASMPSSSLPEPVVAGPSRVAALKLETSGEGQGRESEQIPPPTTAERTAVPTPMDVDESPSSSSPAVVVVGGTSVAAALLQVSSVETTSRDSSDRDEGEGMEEANVGATVRARRQASRGHSHPHHHPHHPHHHQHGPRQAVPPTPTPPIAVVVDDTTISNGVALSPASAYDHDHHHHQQQQQQGEDDSPIQFRDEDVVQSLQLLAYLSKYPHVRTVFHAPSPPSASFSSALPSFGSAGTTGPSMASSSSSSSRRAPILPPTNIFSLVELFTYRPSSSSSSSTTPPSSSASQPPSDLLLPSEVQYWAGVIMRNACRKDEDKGGIRQCANMRCGVWEGFAREFAKCRRCRRAKYCSKTCQSEAWNQGHRYWCHKVAGRRRDTGATPSASTSTADPSAPHPHPHPHPHAHSHSHSHAHLHPPSPSPSGGDSSNPASASEGIATPTGPPPTSASASVVDGGRRRGGEGGHGRRRTVTRRTAGEDDDEEDDDEFVSVGNVTAGEVGNLLNTTTPRANQTQLPPLNLLGVGVGTGGVDGTATPPPPPPPPQGGGAARQVSDDGIAIAGADDGLALFGVGIGGGGGGWGMGGMRLGMDAMMEDEEQRLAREMLGLGGGGVNGGGGGGAGGGMA